VNEPQIKPMERTPLDTGNLLVLQQGPGSAVEITYAKVQTQMGQMLAVTYRTPTTTFTVFFDRANGAAHGSKVAEECSSLTGLIVAGPQVPDTFRNLKI
jgi:hypothetical protein